MDEENKRKLEESQKQEREQAQKLQEISKAKEAQEHDLKFKDGKLFKPSLRKSNVEEIKRFLEFVKKKVQIVDATTPLDGKCKQNISSIYNNINKELQVIKEESGGIEKCLRLPEKSPSINYEQEAKDLKLAQGFVKDLEGYKEELYNLLVTRRNELNHPELETAYREKATLHEAALAGDLDLVQRIVSRGISIQLTTSANQTALHYVALASKPNIAVVEWVVQNGGRPMIDAIDNQGNTALSLAAERGHLDLIRLLRKAGASLNFKHLKSWSLLHVAAYHGQLAVVKYLVEEEKISPLTFDSEGNTALILALGNKHEAVVSYLRGCTERDLPIFYSNLKEKVKQLFGERLAVHVKGICEYAGTNPAHVNLDNLIDGFVETMQAIVKKGESAYVIPANKLKQDTSQEGGSALQPRVREVLQDLLNELKRYALNLPESSQRELDKLSVDNLQPQITAIVRRINKVKEDVTSFAQEQAKQSQERIEKMHASAANLQKRLKQLEQQAAAQKKEKNQKRYELAIRNIAVPSMKYYFIPSLRSSNIEEIRRYMKFIQKVIAKNPVNTPLTVEQQQDIQSLLKQIYQEERELIPSYRDMKKNVEHRGEAFLQEIQKEDQEKLQKAIQGIVKNLTEDTKAAEVEANMIKRRYENVQLAKQLLLELQAVKKELYQICINKRVRFVDYVRNDYESSFENDYSDQELREYFNSCGEAPHTRFRKDFAEVMRMRGQKAFALIMKRLGEPAPVSIQDFIGLLGQVPRFDEIILTHNPKLKEEVDEVDSALIKEDLVMFEQRVKYISQVVLRIIIQSAPHPLGKSIQITSLQEIKKRIHKLTLAIEQKLREPLN